MIGPELVQMTSEKVPIIQQRLKIAFSRQKSYADPKRKDHQLQKIMFKEQQGQSRDIVIDN